MSKPPREFTVAELALVERLLLLAGLDTPERLNEVRHAQVREMDDGGMGSLRTIGEDDRKMGGVIADAVARDLDDILVYFSLIVDKDNRLFELDVWKVDFSPLKAIPSPDALRPA